MPTKSVRPWDTPNHEIPTILPVVPRGIESGGIGGTGQLGAAMGELAGDLALARRLGAAGAEVAAARFDVSVMAQAYSQLFATIVERRGRRGGAC